MTPTDYVGGLTDIVGEDVGDDVGDEMGYDVSGYEIGAPRRGPGGMRRGPVRGMPMPRAMAARIPGLTGQTAVVNEVPSVGRRQIAPIPLTTVNALSTVDVELRPQRPIRIERLVLDGVTLAGLFLTDLLIGAEPQFVNAGAVPASTFAPTAFGTDLRGNTAQPGIAVVLRFQNTTGGAITVGGALIGTSLT